MYALNQLRYLGTMYTHVCVHTRMQAHRPGSTGEVAIETPPSTGPSRFRARHCLGVGHARRGACAEVTLASLARGTAFLGDRRGQELGLRGAAHLGDLHAHVVLSDQYVLDAVQVRSATHADERAARGIPERVGHVDVSPVHECIVDRWRLLLEGADERPRVLPLLEQTHGARDGGGVKVCVELSEGGSPLAGKCSNVGARQELPDVRLLECVAQVIESGADCRAWGVAMAD